MKNNIHNAHKQLAVVFYNQVFADSDDEKIKDIDEADIDWVWDNPYDALHINWYFFSMRDVYDIVMNWYSSDTVFAWYSYIWYYCSDKEEYYININPFAHLYDGTEIEVWADWYKTYRDEQRKRNNLKSEKERQEKDIKEAYKKAEEEIKKYTKTQLK